MQRSLILKAFVILSVAVLTGALFVGGPSYSQHRGAVPTPVPVKPVPPVTVAPRVVTTTPIAATPVVVPSAVPHTPAPRPVDPARVLSTPVRTARTIVPGPGPRLEAESPDCSVRQFQCAAGCDPLPEGWTSYRDCVSHRCRQVDENCIDKLAQELRWRRGDSELTFQITSNYQSKVQLAFYSQDRDVAWPGSGRVYENNDYNAHVYKLSCNSGEQICYGAWTMDLASYWGVGLRNRNACTGCCARCEGQTVSFVLR